MSPADDVNEADRLEQDMPPARDEREERPIPPDAPDADVLEQQLPVVEGQETTGLDAERTEPVSDEDWASTSSGG
ncbi:MAG: hypothetical protein M0010_21405 [Actinomycetota bacterium]|nr:hypothetical protein [Actinomycetota bacterium]